MYNQKQLSTDFSIAAEGYDQHARLQQEILEQALELAQELWPTGSQILDVGCGTGYFAQAALEAECYWDLRGIDIAFGMCQKATKHLPTACSHAENLPFGAESFSGIFSSLMLQWVDKPVDIFCEMYRVLRPGGTVMLTTFVNGTLHELQESFAQIDKDVHVSTFASTGDVATAAVHAGFTMLSAEEEEYTEFYSQLKHMMYTLKAIGATNKHEKRRRSMMTPSQFKTMEAYYRTSFEQKLGLPVSWNVLTMILEKPESPILQLSSPEER